MIVTIQLGLQVYAVPEFSQDLWQLVKCSGFALGLWSPEQSSSGFARCGGGTAAGAAVWERARETC